MNAAELIRRKRDGGRLSPGEIDQLLAAYTDGRLPDYQAAALLMAVFFRGLDEAELSSWTERMLHSGEVVDLGEVPGIKVDKHSTGGVGDMISLALAPLVAACGVVVPMISGRGLGHTGGTLDKLESIPGFRVDLSVDRFREVLRRTGCALIGQTARLVPADRKLYALRDVTGTVESIPLIASSIMSKKLAEGIDALVLDVKVGSGAFMKELGQARELARTMIAIGGRAGKRVSAFLTDMDQPLGRRVGNAIEVEEAILILRGEGCADVRELVLALGAEMLLLGAQAGDEAAARARLEGAIADGSALAKLREITAAQGGDPAAIDDPARLPRVLTVDQLTADRGGVVTAIDAEQVGLAALALGAGRATKEDLVDPAVGLFLHKKVGEAVLPGEPLCALHHRDGRGLTDARERLRRAYRVGETAPAPRPLIHEVLR